MKKRQVPSETTATTGTADVMGAGNNSVSVANITYFKLGPVERFFFFLQTTNHSCNALCEITTKYNDEIQPESY